MATLLVELLSSLITLILGGIVSNLAHDSFLRKIFNIKSKSSKSYSEQLAELTQSLTKSTEEVDRILSELTAVSVNRQEALVKLEADLEALEKRESDAKKRIEELQKVPIPVADYFAEITKAGEKKSARRDYLLFGAGVIVSAIVAIILKLLGWG